MEQKQYINFDLMLEGSAGAYLARVLDSPAGQDKNQFGLLFPPEQLKMLLERISQADEAAATELGKSLFETIFDVRLQGLLTRSLDEAERQAKGLRIRLRLSDVPELINLPWEYLYEPALQRFFARSIDTPIVRFLDLPAREREVEASPPLRVLVMISSPQDYPSLDVEAEWNRLKQALAPLEQKGMLLVERLDQATLPMLHQRLRQKDYHIFHYLGHGATDEEKKTGALVLETEQGLSQCVDSDQLSTLLFDEKSLRLVVLNACQGAQTWASNPFGGVAQGLVQQGVPAVVAMQFPVSDQAAIAFSHGFYSALADSLPVDAAMGEARKAMFIGGNAVEWATPVLYLRSASANLFRLLEETRIEALAAPPTVTPVIKQTAEPQAIELNLAGKWLIIDEADQELTIVLTPTASQRDAGEFTANLYYKPSRTWMEQALEGKWTFDPVKKRLGLSGSFVENGDRFSLTLLIGHGRSGFFNAKDSQGGRLTLERITGEFEPVGKWLFLYELDGPSELYIEFQPGGQDTAANQNAGEFSGTENYKVSKRWVAEDISGQWTYDPAKKRLALNGKYNESGNRFSLTPYINRWEGNHFSAKSHEGREYQLRRVG